MGNFTSWGTYVSRAKPRQHERLQVLSVANARYGFASGLNVQAVNGLSAATADGYIAALRVMLAYTAVEALGAAIGDKQFRLENADLANQVRSVDHAPLHVALTKSVRGREHHKQAAELRDFFESDSSNLRPVAYAIRNLMAHGALTANSMQLTKSKSRRQLVSAIADQALRSTDERFTKYVRGIKWDK